MVNERGMDVHHTTIFRYRAGVVVFANVRDRKTLTLMIGCVGSQVIASRPTRHSNR